MIGLFLFLIYFSILLFICKFTISYFFESLVELSNEFSIKFVSSSRFRTSTVSSDFVFLALLTFFFENVGIYGFFCYWYLPNLWKDKFSNFSTFSFEPDFEFGIDLREPARFIFYLPRIGDFLLFYEISSACSVLNYINERVFQLNLIFNFFTFCSFLKNVL